VPVPVPVPVPPLGAEIRGSDASTKGSGAHRSKKLPCGARHHTSWLLTFSMKATSSHLVLLRRRRLGRSLGGGEDCVEHLTESLHVRRAVDDSGFG